MYNTPLGGCGGNYDYYKSGEVSMYANVGVCTSCRMRSSEQQTVFWLVALWCNNKNVSNGIGILHRMRSLFTLWKVKALRIWSAGVDIQHCGCAQNMNEGMDASRHVMASPMFDT